MLTRIGNFIKCTRFVLCLAATSSAALAYGAEKPAPKRLFMPPTTINIPAEIAHMLREVLNASYAELVAQDWPDATGLDQWLQAGPGPAPTLLLTQAAAKVQASDQPGGFASPESLALAPVVCAVGPYLLTAVTAVSTGEGLLLALGQAALHRDQWTTAEDAQARGELITTALARAWQNAGQKLAGAPSPRADALQVELRSGRELTRKDRASAHCLNLFMAASLQEQGYRVLAPLGGENRAMLDRLGLVRSRAGRATRALLLSWTLPGSLSEALPAPPWKAQLGVEFHEAVFGHPIMALRIRDVEVTVEDDQLSITVPKGLDALLAEEKKGLALADAPKIIHLLRGWAYLDRGRGWGLKMHDRLVGPRGIKGHVIGFFGPTSKLATPDGRAISEGALVYLREGWDDAEVGDTLSYDPRSFPH